MRMDGTWRSRGYGWILEFEGGVPRWYDESPVGRIAIAPPDGGGPADGLTRRGQLLLYREVCGLTDIEFEPARSIPPVLDRTLCADPATNFDVLWGTVHDHHAFLSARAVDWDAVRDHYRPLAAATTSDLELLEVLRAALSELGDGHATIEAPISDDSAPTPGLRDVRSWMNSQAASQLRTYGTGQLLAGWLDHDIGYVGILRMERFAAGSTSAADEVAHAETALQAALEQLHDASGLVIDLRGNPGGWDAVALAVLAAFVEQPLEVFTKCARQGSSTTTPQPVRLTPSSGRRYTGRLAVLVGPLTASAAEVLALASLALPQAVRVGAATRGILSDQLEKALPIGWLFTLSNEIYQDLSGHCPEIAGLVPDVRVDDDPLTPAGLRLALGAAVATLRR